MKLLLVDDHTLFRRGLALLLRDLDPELTVVEAADCATASTLASEACDLVLLDLNMPGMSGLDALAAIRSQFDGTRIVVLSGDEDPRQVRRAIDQGAAGYIPKTSTPGILVSALRLVLAGGTYLPEIALRDVDEPETHPTSREAAPPGVLVLSPRQIEVLNGAVAGKSNKVIARELNLSEATVKAHLSAAFRALGVKNRTEAVFRTARLGVPSGPRP